jgi:hypothetical protein
MSLFVLLVFDCDDAVKYARAVRARSVKDARTIADHVILAHAPVAGYELWSDGTRILSTFEKAPAGAVVSLLPGLRSA